jgi:hypothetical protein
MKVYLAGPMRGYEDHNFPAFAVATDTLRRMGYDVFSPAELGWTEGGDREALATELAWLCRYAEMVVLLPGWEASLGTKAERAAAEALNIPVKTIERVVEEYDARV